MRPAATATRVQRNTPAWLNDRIHGETAQAVALTQLGEPNGSLSLRLRALRREWDVERGIETEAPLMIMAGAALGAFVDRRLLAIPAVAASMLLLHSFQGWYPLLPVFRRLGIRTTREIADEAYALKRQRGDFDQIARDGRPEDRAAQAYAAAGSQDGG